MPESITGYGDVPMTVQAMKAGAGEFLTRPFGDDVLLGRAVSALEKGAEKDMVKIWSNEKEMAS